MREKATKLSAYTSTALLLWLSFRDRAASEKHGKNQPCCKWNKSYGESNLCRDLCLHKRVKQPCPISPPRSSWTVLCRTVLAQKAVWYWPCWCSRQDNYFTTEVWFSYNGTTDLHRGKLKLAVFYYTGSKTSHTGIDSFLLMELVQNKASRRTIRAEPHPLLFQGLFTCQILNLGDIWSIYLWQLKPEFC